MTCVNDTWGPSHPFQLQEICKIISVHGSGCMGVRGGTGAQVPRAQHLGCAGRSCFPADLCRCLNTHTCGSCSRYREPESFKRHSCLIQTKSTDSFLWMPLRFAPAGVLWSGHMVAEGTRDALGPEDPGSGPNGNTRSLCDHGWPPASLGFYFLYTKWEISNTRQASS